MQAPEPELDDLYKEVILDHYKQPRNRGTLDSPDLSGEGYNPVCGDEINLQIIVKENKVSDIKFNGRGCSISQASSSMLTELIKGKGLKEVQALLELFKGAMTDETKEFGEELGDLEALEGVRKFPVRVKCATLAWNVLQDLLQRLGGKNANS